MQGAMFSWSIMVLLELAIGVRQGASLNHEAWEPLDDLDDLDQYCFNRLDLLNSLILKLRFEGLHI